MNNKFYQFLGLTKKSGNLVEGYNKCEEIIKKDKIFLTIISLECSLNTVKKFEKYCSDKNVPVIKGPSKIDLGMALGRKEINILCIKDKNMSDKLIELWNT